MARPLRISYPGAIYHVTARSNARQAIVRDEAGGMTMTTSDSFADLMARLRRGSRKPPRGCSRATRDG